MSDVKLICFDLGRVLVRICDTWAQACERAGVPVPPKFADDVLTQVRSLVHAHEVDSLPHDEYCREMAAHFGVQPEHVDRMMNAFLIDIYPGALDLLDELRTAGYKVACLSNTNVLHWQNMSDPNHPAWLPFDKFDFAFGSQQIGLRKPAEEIYKHVEKTTGFAGSQILFFDDIEENIVAAQRNGWIAELIARDGQPIAQIRKHLDRWIDERGKQPPGRNDQSRKQKSESMTKPE